MYLIILGSLFDHKLMISYATIYGHGKNPDLPKFKNLDFSIPKFIVSPDFKFFKITILYSLILYPSDYCYYLIVNSIERLKHYVSFYNKKKKKKITVRNMYIFFKKVQKIKILHTHPNLYNIS